MARHTFHYHHLIAMPIYNYKDLKIISRINGAVCIIACNFYFSVVTWLLLQNEIPAVWL